MVNKRDLSLRTPGISGLFAIKKPTGGGRKGVAQGSQVSVFCGNFVTWPHFRHIVVHF
jgi:hypothetical protein